MFYNLMKNNKIKSKMKHRIIVLLAMAVFVAIGQLGAQTVTYETTRSGLKLGVEVSDFTIHSVDYKGESLSEISMKGIMLPNDAGLPNLPRISKYIAIPNGAKVEVSYSTKESKTYYDLDIAPAIEIAPSMAVQSEEYVKDETVYGKNALYPEQIVEVSEVTNIRGIDAVIVGITPFQYNPVTKELISYENVEINIEYGDSDGIYGEERLRSRWFDDILKNTFINSEMIQAVDYSQRYNNAKNLEGCEYLIVIPNRDDFMPYAEQIKDFRTEQGIITEIMTLEEMGCTNSAQIKSFLHNAYNTWDIPPVGVLLMGDHNTNVSLGIPAEMISHPYSGPCISDNPYSDVTGDLLSEMVVVRMAAENVSQLEVLVSKAIEYETEPCMEECFYNNPVTALGWQTSRWFQICNEAIGGYWRNNGKEPARVNAIYDGNPGTTWSTATNSSTVINYFGPNGVGYIPATPAELGGWTGGNAAGVNNAINNGGFMLFHSNHGFENGWGEPDYSNSDVQQLSNVGKLIYVIDNDCSTGKFNNSSPCFGETFHRHTYNGENAGAIGVLCPTEVSYSFVNDVYFWGMFDYFDGTFLPDYGAHPLPEYSENWLPAFANVAGKYFLEQSSWPYNDDSKGITYQIYEQHGDAFLRLHTEVPQALAIEHANEIMVEVPFIFSCTEGALVSFSNNGEILTVFEATGEEQEIEMPSFNVDDTITIVCTKQNYLRYKAEIIAIPAEGAYIVGRGWTVNDENEDEILRYSEIATIDCNIKNVGIEDCADMTMTLSTDDPYLTIINNTANVALINSGETLTVEDAFTVKANYDIPDNHEVLCLITYSSNGSSWTSELTVKAYAPILNIISFGIEGQLIPGETVNIVPSIENSGNASIYNAYFAYTSDSEYVTINTTEPVQVGNIDANGGVASASFSITVSEDTPFGTDLFSNISITADYEYVNSLEIVPYVDICNVAISSYPYMEGYEEMIIPECWEQEYVQGETSWSVQDGGYQYHPYHAHTGEGNAFIHGENVITRLVTPTMDLGEMGSATLSFWHAQSVCQSQQDIMNVYYKNATDGEWNLLASYIYSLAGWKQRTIELPNLTSNYFIAFEAVCNGGFGVVLDDVVVTAQYANTVLGDVNNDGNIDVNDILITVNYIMENNPEVFNVEAADVNEDGMININDIMEIVLLIMNQ